MELRFKSRLPGPVAALVDKIETKAGAEILVQHDPTCRREMRAGPCTIDGLTRPVIWYKDSFDCAATVCHELLHLRRQFVSGVPMVSFPGYTVTGRDGEVVTQGSDAFKSPLYGCENFGSEFESIVEHLAIEPLMPRYGFPFPDRGEFVRDWWMRDPVRHWDTNDTAKRWALFLAWLETQFLTTNRGVQELAANVIDRRGLLHEAEDLSYHVRQLLTSPDPVAAKQAITLELCGAIGIVPSTVQLWYVQPGKAEARVEGIPNRFSVPLLAGAPVYFGWRGVTKLEQKAKQCVN